MGGFTVVDFVILVVYLLAVLLAGLHFSKREMKGKEFFKGDGTIPWWVTSVSIFATLLSPISFLSLAGNSYGGTWILWFAQLGIFIAIPLTIKFFLPLYSRLDLDTAYQYLEIRYNSKGLRVLGALMFIVYQIGRMSIIMYLPSVVLAELTGISVNILIIAMGVIAIIYSYTGGLKSVLWTDFIQGMVLIVGVTGTLIYLIANINGGVGTVMETLTSGQKFLAQKEVIFDPNILKTSAFIIFVGAGLNTFSSYVSSQDVVQRFTTTTDLKQLKKMTYGNGVLSIVVATIFYLIGTCLFVFYSQNPELAQTVKQDQIFASYIAYQLPVGITGILLAAIYAASQSTLSTGLNSVATSWTLDIQTLINKDMSLERQTKIAQYISLGVGILSIGVSIVLANGEIKSAYEWFNSFMGLVLGVLAGIFVLGAFCKKATKLGAYIGFAVSAILVIYLKYNVPDVSSWAYSLITITTSVVVGQISSLIQLKLTNKVNKVDSESTIYYESN
ncbi:Na /solute symporter [[Clostridium] sordellii]|uniref:Na+/solute symporter, SSS family n=1 Tax=Paraclostridium sordellii TaxID=1505 RepID=A0ABP1XR69_PARSO|nr:sodium:solute symporter [Paeniclostridium sordellii]CEJ72454.1 putative Na+/solute symporter, SSS family [[Clostridium] sordellii] [Paeniclostridium sordellii]CEN70680.1 Na /solute symporter [[Clostridium] sordellii] [Paeniclostridium sordellii]CEN73823.1 Na /solute symporter [[Clostridium] sordellii] [Paeniclostridium sordellii]CEO28777.1 Na /solute symporter [[Clostridium] sordellii] [Paeniclostridium sordellii]CEP77112.1 Na /solute symporter [[Clostridium] sordellii] [Paeniclostridium so